MTPEEELRVALLVAVLGNADVPPAVLERLGAPPAAQVDIRPGFPGIIQLSEIGEERLAPQVRPSVPFDEEVVGKGIEAESLRTEAQERVAPAEDTLEEPPPVEPPGGPQLPAVEYAAVGAYIRKLREKKGLSIDEVVETVRQELPSAARAFTAEYLQGMERGTTYVYIEHLSSLERVLDAPRGDLHHHYGYLAADEIPPQPRDGWVTVEEAARQRGVFRTSLIKAVARGEIAARRLPAPPGRAQTIILLRLEDVKEYTPRDYPRSTTRRRKHKT